MKHTNMHIKHTLPPPALMLAAPHLVVVCSSEVSRTEKPDPPPRLRPNPGPGVCVTDRGCVFSSRPLELLCFLYPVTGQKLNPHRPALALPNPLLHPHFLNKDCWSKWLSSRGQRPHTIMIYIQKPRQHNYLIP